MVWETYNVDPNARRRVEEPVGQGDAPPSPEDAEGSQPGNIHEAPERKGSSRSDGTGAPTPNVAVIMDKTLEAFQDGESGSCLLCRYQHTSRAKEEVKNRRELQLEQNDKARLLVLPSTQKHQPSSFSLLTV